MKISTFSLMIICVLLAACSSVRGHQEAQYQEIAYMKTPAGYITPSENHYPVPAARGNQSAAPVNLLPPGIHS
jgi:hypothetical protein